MNSNFEEEYKKYADIDTPDLWSRIEAGVDALESAKEALEQPKEDVSHKDGSKTINISSSKKYNMSRFEMIAKRYGGMVAAVACGVLVLSVIGITKSASKGSYSAASESAAPAAMAESNDAAASGSDMAMAEEAPMAEEADEAPMAEESAAAMAETYEAADEEEAAPPEEIYAEAQEAAEPAADSAYGFKADEAPVMSAKTAGAEEYAKDSSHKTNDAREASYKQEDDGLPEMQIKAEIISAQTDPDTSASKDEDALILTLTVTDPSDTGLKKGAEITAHVDPAINETLYTALSRGPDKSGQYEITLKNRNGDYILTSIK